MSTRNRSDWEVEMAVLRADDDDKDVALILIETLLGEERGKWKMRLGGVEISEIRREERRRKVGT